MAIPQTGVFALAETSHLYLEFAMAAGATAEQFVRAVCGMQAQWSSVDGANVVVGFRPELWRSVAPDDTPAALTGFNQPLTGIDDYVMPATQTDLWVWIAGALPGVVFDRGREASLKLAACATLARELAGWSYRRNRDLTGFEDGTENPALMLAPGVATIPDGAPGSGGTVLLYQQWRHETASWAALPDAAQERVIGRTKLDSIELAEDVMPADSHVSRTTVEENGEERDIFRRNTAYGIPSEHGTVFVGFGADQDRLERMLRRMAGAEGGVRDALTRYTTPLTGAYYFVPSLQALQRFAPAEEE
jgi:porphyrinogen peroxidase